MNRKNEKELNDTDEVTLVTLSDLLRDGVAIPALATAIEKIGIYGWDKCGRFGNVGDDGKEIALNLLAKQLAWEGDPLPDKSGDSRSPRELSDDDSNGEFGHFCWPAGELPDFDAIDHEYVSRRQDEDGPAKRKAPDKFVLLLIRLLVEIAKRDPALDVTQMPGTKKDFFELATKTSENFDDYKFTTFETYIKGLISFRAGSKSSKHYQKFLDIELK
jgi:hypothetical protein